MDKELLKILDGGVELHNIYKNKCIQNLESPYGDIKFDRFFSLLLLNMTTMSLPQLNKVIIKKSTIPTAGLGVFTNKNVKKGEILTIYPCDIFKIHMDVPNVPLLNVNVPLVSNRVSCLHNFKEYDDKDYFIRDNLTLLEKYTKSCKYMYNHRYTNDNNIKYSISGDPMYTDDMNFVGHIINDGAKSNGNVDDAIIYHKITVHRQNCEVKFYHNIFPLIYAVKDIKCNEELFFPYGLGYWKYHG